jgi:hypothetical protein
VSPFHKHDVLPTHSQQRSASVSSAKAAAASGVVEGAAEATEASATTGAAINARSQNEVNRKTLWIANFNYCVNVQ